MLVIIVLCVMPYFRPRFRPTQKFGENIVLKVTAILAVKGNSNIWLIIIVVGSNSL